MKRFSTAVVIGKFYPPHRGHKHLIDTASAQSEHVTVFVCDEDGQTISGAQRAIWLREIHPNADVRVVRSPLAPDDSPGWAQATIDWLGYAPAAVFTSEEYGDRYAALMGSTHVSVDADRRTVPISGSIIRADPLRHLDALEPCVRAHFVKRVVVIGAESTGTTTLAMALADHYKTTWVPEFGRLYTEARRPRGELWRSDEFTFIAIEQARMEDALARLANTVLICDTDPFATAIWHERYLGRPSSGVLAIAANRRYDLYILTDTDIPFVQDGIRDGEGIRQWMHDRFHDELSRTATPMLVVSGPHEHRMAAAVARVDQMVRAR
jgi:HTH-type transcriptional regulator, transcriptional repressor of NAD biosynthesis genes